jgi:uncharacterized OB-fold protein
MSLPVIGKVGPRPDGIDAPFWAALAGGELKLQRCSICRTWIWGPQWVCPECRTMEPGWEATPMRGTIFTWTRTHQPFVPDFKDHLPYVTVVVELPGAGGRRLLGLLLGDTPPRIGDPVEGVIEDVDGVAVLRWRASRGRWR